MQERFRQFFNPTAPLKPCQLQEMEQQFSAWRDTAADAVRYTAGLPKVDKGRIGLVGFSLGACLALAAVAQPGVEVAAVVELFGALPGQIRGEVERLPPTLIIHGDADRLVPPAEAENLRALVKAFRAKKEPCWPRLSRARRSSSPPPSAVGGPTLSKSRWRRCWSNSRLCPGRCSTR